MNMFSATTTKWIRLEEVRAIGRQGGGTVWLRIVDKIVGEGITRHQARETRLLGGTTILPNMCVSLLAVKKDGRLVGNKIRAVRDVDFSLKMWRKRLKMEWDEVWMSQGDGRYGEKGVLMREMKWNKRLKNTGTAQDIRGMRRELLEMELLKKRNAELEEKLRQRTEGEKAGDELIRLLKEDEELEERRKQKMREDKEALEKREKVHAPK